MKHFDRYSPIQSLRQGHWFKLICGASFQDLPIVRNLSLIYTLAGADCIDVAFDPAVIAAAEEGIESAIALQEQAITLGFGATARPWLMVSINDGEDPHFRKAAFDPKVCPADCPRPCVGICPAQAIAFETAEKAGVIDARCYGCGRCLPICPSQIIVTRSTVSSPAMMTDLLSNPQINALEIHTQVGHQADFSRLWQAIAPYAHRLDLLAISCPDHSDLLGYLYSLSALINPLPCLLLWQLDGRPMSGDIGKGTTHATIKLAQKVMGSGLPGYLQLAGGTNGYTVPKLRELGLLSQDRADSPKIIGVAYGSYARSLLSPIWQQWDAIANPIDGIFPHPRDSGFSFHLEDYPDLLWQAVELAHALVAPLKATPPIKITQGHAIE